MTIAIAAGSRDFHVSAEYWPLLDEARERCRLTAIWHSGAQGADEGVSLWASARGLDVEAFPAPWDLFKQAKIPVKAAGARRIDDMLAGRRGYVLVPPPEGEKRPPTIETTEQLIGRPEVLLALPGYAGTRRTIRAAEQAGLEVVRLQFEPWVANKYHYRLKDGGYRFPPGAVDIQRGTALGNPFVVGDPIDVAVAELGRDAVASVLGRWPRSDDQITGDTCLALYRFWLMRQIRKRDRGVLSALTRIIGPKSVLMCTCKGQDGRGLCHGDVVVRAWRYVHGRRQPDAPRDDAEGGKTPEASGQVHDGSA